jgi:hypothetical protein
MSTWINRAITSPSVVNVLLPEDSSTESLFLMGCTGLKALMKDFLPLVMQIGCVLNSSQENTSFLERCDFHRLDFLVSVALLHMSDQ